LLAAFH